jgi:hypothetical protein
MVDADGKVYAGNTTYRDKNFMTEINKWFSEGLFDPDWSSFVNMNYEGFRQRWLADQFGYLARPYPTSLASSRYSTSRARSGCRLSTRCLLRAENTHWHETHRLYYGSACVSTSCENIELAITWLDWRYSPTAPTS